MGLTGVIRPSGRGRVVGRLSIKRDRRSIKFVGTGRMMRSALFPDRWRAHLGMGDVLSLIERGLHGAGTGRGDTEEDRKDEFTLGCDQLNRFGRWGPGADPGDAAEHGSPARPRQMDEKN